MLLLPIGSGFHFGKISLMKKSLLVILALLFLTGCTEYQNGYRDGYNGNGKQSSSKNYTIGYWDGVFDGNCDYLEEKGFTLKYKAHGCVPGKKHIDLRGG